MAPEILQPLTRPSFKSTPFHPKHKSESCQGSRRTARFFPPVFGSEGPGPEDSRHTGMRAGFLARSASGSDFVSVFSVEPLSTHVIPSRLTDHSKAISGERYSVLEFRSREYQPNSKFRRCMN